MGWGAVVRKAGCGVRDGDHQVAAGRFVENESDKDLWAPHATHLYERGKDGNYLLFENRFGTLSIDASGLRPALSKDKVSWCLKIVVDGS